MRIIGKSKDFQLIYGDVFEDYDTYGIPISISISLIKDNNGIFCVEEFIGAALAKPWDDVKIINELTSAYNDAGMLVSKDEIERKFKLIIFKHWDGKIELNELGRVILKKYQ